MDFSKPVKGPDTFKRRRQEELMQGGLEHGPLTCGSIDGSGRMQHPGPSRRSSRSTARKVLEKQSQQPLRCWSRYMRRDRQLGRKSIRDPDIAVSVAFVRPLSKQWLVVGGSDRLPCRSSFFGCLALATYVLHPVGQCRNDDQ